ncbi:MAG: glycosyltransferase [Verrucomicrobia bacterium]|nr:glycosyltransferase [Verrucomicrobiota bacterium]
MPLLSVIMPAYNESGRIRDAIFRTHRQLERMTPDFQIVAVDDGSSDGTGDFLDRTAGELDRVTVVKLQPNRGKGEALRQGFLHATGRLIFFLDADMDLPPEQMDVFLRTMREEGADAVIGSKMHPESRVDYPLHRRVVSVVYFTITRILFGLPIRDTQTGLKLFRREVLERCMPRMLVKAFAYDLELLALAHHDGFRIAEAPVVIEYHPKYGYLPFNAIRSTAIDTLAIFYRLYIWNYYDDLSDRDQLTQETRM